MTRIKSDNVKVLHVNHFCKSFLIFMYFVFPLIICHLGFIYDSLWLIGFLTLKASKSRRHRQVKLDSSDSDSASGQGQIKASRKKRNKETLKSAGRKMSSRNRGNILKSFLQLNEGKWVVFTTSPHCLLKGL